MCTNRDLRRPCCLGTQFKWNPLRGPGIVWVAAKTAKARAGGGSSGPGVPCKGALFQQVRVLPRQRSSRPGSYPSSRGGNEAAEAWEKGGSFQVVCKLAGHNASEHRDGSESHDAKADPAWTGGRLVRIGGNWATSPIRFAGVVGDGTSTRNDGQHGKPAWVWPDRLGHQTRQASGSKRVAEGLVVPRKPGNAGGGKGPWFQGADEAARDGGDWL